MVKRSEHLTTEQLSALIDTQLSMEEAAICKAHLQTCEQCQSRLAGLQQTVGLLRAMPQPELPRSFALPTGVRYLQERPERQGEEQREAATHPPARRRAWSYRVQRALRASSMIAAVIGLVFLLSGVLPLLSYPGGGTTTSSSAPVSQPAQRMLSAAPNLTATSKAGGVSDNHATSTNGRLAPNASPRPGKTPGVVRSTPATLNNNATPPEQPQPPIIDLNTPLGRQGVGFILLVVGIIGVLLTRRRRQRQT